jgi:hypothetical protein
MNSKSKQFSVNVARSEPSFHRRTWQSVVTSFLLLLALALCFTALPGRAQSDTVTISAAEFQRLVYSAHLHTQLAEKPELDASLQVLLELHRRNPHADPAALADLSRQALQRYRTNAPAYIRTSGFRDEILAAYLDALRQVPARTNFVQANLQLLNGYMLSPDDYTTASPAELIHSGNQRLLSSEGVAAKRQALVDTCVARAHGRAAFAVAMDGLLLLETRVSVGDTPTAIIGNPTNSPLHDNETMTNLLALSSIDGSVTVTSNYVKWLFERETEDLWVIVRTNRDLLLEFNQSQPDLAAFLTNQTARAYWEGRETAVRQGQARKIASSIAAVLVQSQLTAAPEASFKVPKWFGPVASTVGGLATLAGSKGKDSGAFISSITGLLGLFDDSESPDDQIVREIGNLKTMIGELSQNMNYRFDRVDQSLTTIFETLNEEFSKIEITLDAQGRQIAHLNGDADEIRRSLVDVQADLHRLERHLLSYLTELSGRGLKQDLNFYLGYEDTFSLLMAYTPDYIAAENAFFTHARNNAVDGLSAPFLGRDYTAVGLFNELSETTGGSVSNRLDQNVNYIKKYLAEQLLQPTAGSLPLANPRDWFVGAYAYAQLAVENPRYFRQVNPATRLDLIATRGQELTDFFRSLTFTGPNINSNLYTSLENYYAGKFSPFLSQVQATEQQYANDNHFPLDTWRQWSAAAPRVTATATEVLGAPVPPPQIPPDAVTKIAAGFEHGLALKSNGTLVAWATNLVGYGHSNTNIPASATNVVAIAAGSYHSLALKADGSVVGWGNNPYGQTNIPASAASGVVAIAAGGAHSLALKADGSVVGWGWNIYGQTNIPASATSVVAIAGGGYHSLALKADGSVVGWGRGRHGQTNIPASATSGVVAIAAGEYHSLALKADGSVVGWGGWGEDYGQTTIPASATSGVVAIAAGYVHSLALKADGSVVVWGGNNHTLPPIPASLTNVVAIAASYIHSLFLKTTGSSGSAGSEGLSFVRAEIPKRVGNFLVGANNTVLTNLDLDLHASAADLSGAKALLTAVLELGMPYTLERDEVLHGFLYGSESLVDLDASRTFLQAENAKLLANPDAKPQALTEVAVLRYQRFAERLTARLNDLQATGQPEIPRLVGHTLRLLNLLRDSWSTVPPPALEIGRETNNTLGLVLYGEPYAHYTLQYRDNLNVPGWTAATVTNLHSEQLVTSNSVSGPSRFYRAILPVP